MTNSTTDVYQTKREILNYAGKLSRGFGKVKRKFIADMIYGITASGSVKLSDIADRLNEKNKKKNTIERLSRHLSEGVIVGLHKTISEQYARSYLTPP